MKPSYIFPPLCVAPTRDPVGGGWSRRRVLGALASVPLACHLTAQARDAEPILIGQSTTLTGPLGALGQAVHQGAKVCFETINAKGGVLGRRVELTVADDAYDVKRALANVGAFMADPNTFALFNCFGTPAVEAMLPQVIESGIPFFAPYTGATAVRPTNARNVFNIRASYAQEAERLVQQLVTLGIRRIAVAYQNNAFGKEVFTAAQKSLASYKLEPTATATVENNASDAATAAGKIAASQPEAVLLGLAGKLAIDFAAALRLQSKGMPMYALSIVGSAATLKAMGANALGMIVSQIVPMPSNVALPLVRDFQQAWKAAKLDMEPSHLALEGYINARVFAEVLRRAGKNPTRASFIDAAWNAKQFDLGGFPVNFAEGMRNASHFVELTMVAKDGRFIR